MEWPAIYPQESYFTKSLLNRSFALFFGRFKPDLLPCDYRCWSIFISVEHLLPARIKIKELSDNKKGLSLFNEILKSINPVDDSDRKSFKIYLSKSINQLTATDYHILIYMQAFFDVFKKKISCNIT